MTKNEDIYLAFENGESFEATLRGGELSGGGEAVFTTAYTGYEESLTDPSYGEQALVFAYPLIGNYGVDERRFESDSVQPELVITRQVTDDVANWLDDEGVPVISNVDTRSIVTMIRDEGSMTCAVGEDKYGALTAARDVPRVSDVTDIADLVGTDEIERYGPEDGVRIALIDCGVKTSMIDQFTERGARVIRLPNDTIPEVVMANDPGVLFVSNGPGDPSHYDHVIDLVEAFTDVLPIAGICLGQQIIAHAHEGDTQQMKFGHRGSNQPVKPDDGPVKMTTQNHSFEVSDPGSLEVVERNVNDGSPEGLRGDGVITRQYHPEASPGPHDSFEFFDRVLDMSRKA